MNTILEIPQIKNAGMNARLKLVEDLLVSIGDIEITKGFKDELIQRGDELVLNPKIGRPWSKVKVSRKK